jgi:hypothetical protein
MDGPWITLGQGEGTTDFDLQEMTSIRFLKIQDDGDGFANIPDAGVELDATEVISAPGQVINPFPQDDQNNIQPFTSFNWQKGVGGNPALYLFSLGTDDPPSNILSGLAVWSDSYSPEELLEFQSQYFWRIDACNSYDTTIGNTWTFLTIRPPDEDWESGDFSKYNWTFAGDADWLIDTSTAFFGDHAARSGVVGDNQASSLRITLDVEGFLNPQISFYRKVSSAAGDRLEFYIDNVLMDYWTGMSDYSKEVYLLSAGIHIFEWSYVKNEFSSAGDDCAWIDYIYFPPLAPSTVFAGNDTTVCEGTSLSLSGYATNYNTIQWSTSGSGTFSNISSPNTIYTPSLEDVASGSVNLTLTIWTGQEYLSDDLILSFYYLPGIPATPEGPETVDVFYSTASTYITAGSISALSFLWDLQPPLAGLITGNELTATVEWNINYIGNAYVSVKGINDCGEGPFSGTLLINVINTVKIQEFNLTKTDFLITPNPMDGNFKILLQSGDFDKIHVKIFNQLGNLCFEEKEVYIVQGQSEFINVGNLLNGMYYIFINNGTFCTFNKFIILK